jgi:hypothetical protein
MTVTDILYVLTCIYWFSVNSQNKALFHYISLPIVHDYLYNE